MSTWLRKYVVSSESDSFDISWRSSSSDGLLTLAAYNLTTVPRARNTNRKSSLASRSLPSACCSDDQKCSKSCFGSFDFGIRRRGYCPHFGSCSTSRTPFISIRSSPRDHDKNQTQSHASRPEHNPTHEFTQPMSVVGLRTRSWAPDGRRRVDTDSW